MQNLLEPINFSQIREPRTQAGRHVTSVVQNQTNLDSQKVAQYQC